TSVALILEVIHPFEADDDHVVADLRASVDYWRRALLPPGSRSEAIETPGVSAKRRLRAAARCHTIGGSRHGTGRKAIGVPHRAPGLLAAPGVGAERLWLPGARLFDGTGRPVRENVAILVHDGVIQRVTDASAPSPDGALALDVGRRVLMPGLIDAHTH